MNKKKKPVMDEERKVRNISDYVFDCTNRLRLTADLLSYIVKQKKDFVDVTGNSMSIIVSMYDVYSRDTIVVLGNVVDGNNQTSSLYTFVSYVKDEKKRARYTRRIDRLKKDLNTVIQARGNKVAHFNTKLNIHEKGHFHINQMIQIDPRLLKRMAKRIDTLVWNIREDLDIEGSFWCCRGDPLVQSFQRLIGKKPKL
jgi:hypothetical protein